MRTWYKAIPTAATWLGRFYGTCILAVGGVFLYLSVHGLIAYMQGTRASWSEPVVCVIGIIIAGLSFWVAVQLFKNEHLARQLAGGRHVDELDTALNELNKLKELEELKQSDPAKAQRLLEEYLAREKAKASPDANIEQ